MHRTGANARFDRTSYRWTSRHAAARGGHALLIDGGYPRSRRHPHSRRGHEPTCRRRTPAAHCRRPRRRPHRRRPPTRHFCAARASASPPPSHLPPARHRCLGTEMPPLSPSHASPPSHRRRYRCCPDPGAGARLPYLTTTTTVAARSRAPPPPSRRPVPTLPEGEALHRPRSRAEWRDCGRQHLLGRQPSSDESQCRLSNPPLASGAAGRAPWPLRSAHPARSRRTGSLECTVQTAELESRFISF